MSMQATEIQTEKKVTCKSGHRRDYRVQFINYKNHNSFQTFYFKVVLGFYFLGVFVVLLGLDCIQGLWTNGENLLRDGLYIAFVHVSIFILIQRFLKSLSERLSVDLSRYCHFLNDGRKYVLLCPVTWIFMPYFSMRYFLIVY